MKLLFCLVVVSLLAAAWGETPRAQLRKYHSVCQSESGVSNDILDDARKFKKVKHPDLQKHALCILTKAGHIDSKGDFQVDAMKTQFKENHDPEDVDKFVDKCAVKKHLPMASATKFTECMLEYYSS